MHGDMSTYAGLLPAAFLTARSLAHSVTHSRASPSSPTADPPFARGRPIWTCQALSPTSYAFGPAYHESDSAASPAVTRFAHAGPALPPGGGLGWRNTSPALACLLP